MISLERFYSGGKVGMHSIRPERTYSRQTLTCASQLVMMSKLGGSMNQCGRNRHHLPRGDSARSTSARIHHLCTSAISRAINALLDAAILCWQLSDKFGHQRRYLRWGLQGG
jgi:hypothetical protein